MSIHEGTIAVADKFVNLVLLVLLIQEKVSLRPGHWYDCLSRYYLCCSEWLHFNLPKCIFASFIIHNPNTVSETGILFPTF